MLCWNSELAIAACGEGGTEEAGQWEEGDGAGLICLGVLVEMPSEGVCGMERELLQTEED